MPSQDEIRRCFYRPASSDEWYWAAANADIPEKIRTWYYEGYSMEAPPWPLSFPCRYRDVSFPNGFSEFVGQRPVIQALFDACSNAVAGGCPSHPILLVGEPGLGKSTTAELLSQEMRTRLVPINGNNERYEVSFGEQLSRLTPLHTLYVKGIDRLSADRQKELAAFVTKEITLQPQPFDFGRFWGGASRCPFSLIGSTARPDLIEPELLACFKTQVEFEPYSMAELTVLVDRVLRELVVGVISGANYAIAENSWGSTHRCVSLSIRAWRRARDLDLMAICPALLNDIFTTEHEENFGLEQPIIDALSGMLEGPKPIEWLKDSVTSDPCDLRELILTIVELRDLARHVPDGIELTSLGRATLKALGHIPRPFQTSA